MLTFNKMKCLSGMVFLSSHSTVVGKPISLPTADDFQLDYTFSNEVPFTGETNYPIWLNKNQRWREPISRASIGTHTSKTKKQRKAIKAKRKQR